jgi:hypothetical protein
MAMKLIVNQLQGAASALFLSDASPTNPFQNKRLPLLPLQYPNLFSYLHHAGNEGNKESAIKNDMDKEQLKLLSALTILMVREHEVVAAVSWKQSIADTTEVVISAHSEHCEGGLPLSKPNNVYEQLRSIFYATANPRQQKDQSVNWDSLTPGPGITQPVIINPEHKVPADLLEARDNDDLYQRYVKKYWWASFN